MTSLSTDERQNFDSHSCRSDITVCCTVRQFVATKLGGCLLLSPYNFRAPVCGRHSSSASRRTEGGRLPVATVALLLSEGMTESWSISGCKGPVGTAVSCMAMWIHWQVTSILGTGERSALRSDRFTCDK